MVEPAFAKDDDTALSVSRANALTTESFDNQIMVYALKHAQLPPGFTVETLAAPTMSEATLHECFLLLEQTSSSAYKASRGGWSPRRKNREMRQPDMRYVILRSDPKTSDGALVGFLEFMLSPEADFFVNYCYEVHIVPGMQGKGLGACLMRILEAVGSLVGVQKTMLTCFTSNEAGMRFYQRHGYEWYDEEVVPPPKRLRIGAKTPGKPQFVILAKDL